MEIKISKKCKIIGCQATTVSKDLCSKHYKRWKRHGSTSEEFGKITINGENIQKHPLYSTWRNISKINKGNEICERWKKFLNFVEDIKDKPDGKFFFTRKNATEKYSLENVFWKKIETEGTKKINKAEYMKKYMKKLRLHNPEYFVSADLKKKYGLTIDQYNEMLKLQNNRCKICNQKETATDYKYKKIRRLAVDHCHETSKIRGLLCSACNTAIGLLKHDEKLLDSAIKYLRET